MKVSGKVLGLEMLFQRYKKNVGRRQLVKPQSGERARITLWPCLVFGLTPTQPTWGGVLNGLNRIAEHRLAQGLNHYYLAIESYPCSQSETSDKEAAYA